MIQRELEGDFSIMWRTLGRQQKGPAYVAQYEFHDGRKWAFDFAWPEQHVAVEIDGGQWQAHGGRHARDDDRVKLNQAAIDGWRVLRYSGAMLADPEAVVGEVLQALGGVNG